MSIRFLGHVCSKPLFEILQLMAEARLKQSRQQIQQMQNRVESSADALKRMAQQAENVPNSAGNAGLKDLLTKPQ